MAAGAVSRLAGFRAVGGNPMNQIIEWLKEGDLRSNGRANEVADLVLENPLIFEDLLASLDHTDDVVRAHGADAMEKVARYEPDLFIPHLGKLVRTAQTESIAAVKMHLAMLFGHLVAVVVDIAEIKTILLYLLADKSVFTQSWAIASLCIVARKYPGESEGIIAKIAPLQTDQSTAIRSRAKKAMNILLDDTLPFIDGWVKSVHLQDI